ncbi:hypothetical protein ACOCJ5_09915 [Knoellia sp. CPCC 206450]|uniref:hypothetical protein n=1 Tax=Knoellia tibetensis TaxID=3404798 RepID=UPI003B42D79F
MTDPTGQTHALEPYLPAVRDPTRVARRWAVCVLTAATVALAAWLTLGLVAVWLVGSTIEAVSARDIGTLDVAGLLVTTLPGLVGGWAVGLGAAVLLGRGEAMGARAAGVAAGLLGVVVGAALLAATGAV